MTRGGPAPIIHRTMDERGTLHRIEEDLREDWVERWAGDGVDAIERYLAKHLAFQLYLDESAAA